MINRLIFFLTLGCVGYAIYFVILKEKESPQLSNGELVEKYYGVKPGTKSLAEKARESVDKVAVAALGESTVSANPPSVSSGGGAKAGIQPCKFNEKYIESGKSVRVFRSPSEPEGNECAYEERLCKDGKLSGSFGFPHCVVVQRGGCAFAGQLVENHASVLAFSLPMVQRGKACSVQKRNCENGQLSGSYVYDSCVAATDADCDFHDTIVKNGQKIAAYNVAVGNVMQECKLEYRECSSGVLSGTFNARSCTTR